MTHNGWNALYEQIEITDWPFIRHSQVCPICQVAKPLGKFFCDGCAAKDFGSMIDSLTRAERRLRWEAERNPDVPAARRKTDPKLENCHYCKRDRLIFVQTEVPGEIVGNRFMATIGFYVYCKGCYRSGRPMKNKKLALIGWIKGPWSQSSTDRV
jgi:hypothetical protein